MGVSKQCKSYQSAWTCLCFGNPTVKLGHQHVWLCIMWLDFAQRLFLTKLQNTGLVVYISINHKVAIVLYFVLQKILTHAKQLFQTGPAFCNCSQSILIYNREKIYVIELHWQSYYVLSCLLNNCFCLVLTESNSSQSRRTVCCKYVLLTEFEGRTVSYRPSFFLLDLWPKREARGP